MRALDEFDLVLPWDDAVIDAVGLEDEGGRLLAKYQLERDTDILKLPPDSKAIRFWCRGLTRYQRRRVREYADGSFAQAELAFRYGVMRVFVEGAMYKPHRADHRDAMDEDALDDLEERGIGDREIYDIGCSIFARSGLGKGREPRCLVPASSLDEVRAALSRHAERAKQEHQKSTDEEDESGSPQPSEK